MKAKLYLIPTPLGEYAPSDILPAPVLERIAALRLFFVEELRTARRFLSAAGWKGHVEELELLEINEHTPREQIEAFAARLDEQDAGLISEAGLPAVADPGALLVELAHRKGVDVVPMVGPSSLMMALMASGLNGQCFAFTGYLPVKAPARREAISTLERTSARLNQSQIMIETPYRNDALLADLTETCRPSTRLCVAADITCPTEFIRTKSIADWQKERKKGFVIGKRPCVFVILSEAKDLKNR
ncbi:MAG: SAM-dependent methyltransferase [Bacteroidales bacterium]|nr:SAM-dependent methyltransferase [Bacteroidales bacterium]